MYLMDNTAEVLTKVNKPRIAALIKWLARNESLNERIEVAHWTGPYWHVLMGRNFWDEKTMGPEYLLGIEVDLEKDRIFWTYDKPRPSAGKPAVAYRDVGKCWCRDNRWFNLLSVKFKDAVKKGGIVKFPQWKLPLPSKDQA